jgi:hypothetical protein
MSINFVTSIGMQNTGDFSIDCVPAFLHEAALQIHSRDLRPLAQTCQTILILRSPTAEVRSNWLEFLIILYGHANRNVVSYKK